MYTRGRTAGAPGIRPKRDNAQKTWQRLYGQRYVVPALSRIVLMALISCFFSFCTPRARAASRQSRHCQAHTPTIKKLATTATTRRNHVAPTTATNHLEHHLGLCFLPLRHFQHLGNRLQSMQANQRRIGNVNYSWDVRLLHPARAQSHRTLSLLSCSALAAVNSASASSRSLRSFVDSSSSSRV